eukprot:CAMPEP_0197733556 /NCGR_PEP_ID=MMETSP1434-20131217/43951_1 /TAXON_ID=265543 /ORGANISM="Minutocellus polymorphus, Strain CCMP3303" /LENGTH=430 /DNA_ID=CAMNT_0043320929 /DNA_START=77 /DNA_END=1369 /DNA_ORIENTATION=-
MSTKRPQNALHFGVPAGQLKRLKAGAKEPTKVEASAHRSCTFQSLGDDELCHILSFLLCLPKPLKPPKMPSAAYMYHYRASSSGKEWKTEKPGVRPNALTEFRQLSDEVRKKYYRMAGLDWAIFNGKNATYKIYLKRRFEHPRHLADACRTISLVSSHVHGVVGKFINCSAPQDIMVPEDLAKIKARVGRLDLSSVHRSFLNLCDDLFCDRKFLPSDLYHHHGCGDDDENHCPLEYVLRHYVDSDYEKLADAISAEYRKFLVIKAVELQAQKVIEGNETLVSSSSSTSTWVMSSMPGQLVHIFWQSHMLSPRKYFEDCMTVTGAIIDCNCSSYSAVDPKSVCQYISKRKILFNFEHRLTKEYFHTGRRQPALYSIQNVIEVASMLREEEAVAAAEEDDDTDTDNDEDGGENGGHADNESENEHVENDDDS